MPFKVVIRKMNTEIPEKHYIHAENIRECKSKAEKFFRPGVIVRKLECFPTTELSVREECGIFED